MRKTITYVGLDVNKDTIVVCLAGGGLRGNRTEVRESGRSRTRPAHVEPGQLGVFGAADMGLEACNYVCHTGCHDLSYRGPST